MRSSSKYCVTCLIAASAIASDGRAATEKTGTPYRPGISQAGSTVIIQQADRLVIVQGGKRTAVAQIRLLDDEPGAPGRAIPVEVTIVADRGGSGAIVRVEDRKVTCDGDASIEFVPREDVSDSTVAPDGPKDAVALSTVGFPGFRGIRAMGDELIGEATGIPNHAGVRRVNAYR